MFLTMLYFTSTLATGSRPPFEDGECRPVRVTRLGFYDYRPKPNVCLNTNQSVAFFDEEGNLLFANVQNIKLSTIYERCPGGAVTRSSLDGGPISEVFEYANLNAGPGLTTCFIQDFGAPFGILKGTARTLPRIQIVEYTNPNTGELMGYQTVEPRLRGTSGGERFTFNLFYPGTAGKVAVYSTFVGEGLPLSECDDLIPPGQNLCANNVGAQLRALPSQGPTVMDNLREKYAAQMQGSFPLFN